MEQSRMKLGIIGGSGLYDIDSMERVEEVQLDTPFGAPSDSYRHGRLGNQDVYFLPRHGRGHRFLPSEINHRANIHGFKQLGVSRILSFTAVGSLRETVRPQDILFPTQYYDRTKQNHTFFGNGVAAHIPFGDPVCLAMHARLHALSEHLIAADALFAEIRLHPDGTYVNMEGPAFSTRAESETYRTLGFDVIGMTSLPEAKLSREAGICYAPVSLVTDYDCWHASEDVHVEMVVENVAANTRFARALIVTLASDSAAPSPCGCARALEGAIMTDPAAIPADTREKLKALLS
jgi:5'-methylthioadenosine phosphorylase